MPFWWTEVEELLAQGGQPGPYGDLGPAVLEAAGVSVENHTLTHPCRPRCDDVKAVAEVADADRRLRDALGRAPRVFAYPNGDWTGAPSGR
jgi:peptidoglycan/xylan/chitin deacetylase (PgdA/CDA1 family)